MKEEKIPMEEKKSGKLKRIFYFIVIPFLLILTVVLVISTFSGFNIFQEAAKIPVIGTLFSDEESSHYSAEDYEREINELQANLKNQEAEVKELQSKLDDKKEEIAKLKEEKAKLENQSSGQDEENEDQTNSSWNDLIKTYENMKPQSAANILLKMDETTALNIMADLKEETLARILEKMPAENAAIYTGKLASYK